MSNEIEISNVKEFNKQRAKEIYEKGKYTELRILVEYEDSIPISELDMINVTSEDVARLICATKNQLEHIKEVCPEAFEIAECMYGKELYSEENSDE